MSIREASKDDFERVWPIIREVAAAGETYGFPRDLDPARAMALWFDEPRQTFVYEEHGRILGTYYIKSNQEGPGAHVCNCGYMVAPQARGRGIATAMCLHSQQIARALGYKGMQFNFVASTNEVAVRLWSKLGFAIVGRLPKAFHHPTKGYVDALVMYKWLEPEASVT